jgi:uncharacterized membrane protein SirB2
MNEKSVIMILGVIVIFMLIVLIDLRYLLKASNRRKAMFVYILLIGFELSISILLISGLEIMSPAMILEKIVRLIIPGKPVQ